ncbi:piggyBac transposable element-derived protein 3-like [Schistocerca cancellata]|uniref:piggyBac transposable element-derived protein 3-like n=1 Tax=Schistocerca cancellata TaxID=274614 RepID=UPI0021180682|nr:piggyBac transposable element-derived protein 3-like [Schistocerca cancellata]
MNIFQGASGNVLRLTSVIPEHRNSKIFFDNWFCSLDLHMKLAERGIYCLGTVCSNRLNGCLFDSDKKMKRSGRGAIDERQCSMGNMQYSAVKWHDNRFVTLLRNFVGANPNTEVERFDKKLKKSVKVACPRAVVEYNQFMGGVDLVDSVVALYRIQIYSKKWYHRIFFHILNLVVVNAWFLYTRDALSSGMHWKSMLTLAVFRKAIVRGLLFQGKSEARKQGRPRSNSTERSYTKKKKKKKKKTICSYMA